MTPFTTATSGLLTPMLEFRNVPQLMAEDDYLELVATALPGTAVAAGRRFSPLALARLCGATSWASAAEALDLVVSRSESIAGRMTTFVTDPQQLWGGIVGLAERLRQRGPVDYRARRRIKIISVKWACSC
jgi:hypothetical protein